MSTRTGLGGKLVIVLYQSFSVFDQQVQAKVAAGLPLVAEKKDFETAYEFPSELQFINLENSSLAVPSAATA